MLGLENAKRNFYIINLVILAISLIVLFINRYILQFPTHFYLFVLIIFMITLFYTFHGLWKDKKDILNNYVRFGVALTLFIIALIIYVTI